MEQFTQTWNCLLKGENLFFHFPLNQPPTNTQTDSDLFAVLNRNTKRKKKSNAQYPEDVVVGFKASEY